MRLPEGAHGGGDIATAFFDDIAAAGITTIQFKSTRTLQNAFAGEEDFDLLVPPDRMPSAVRIAEALGFRVRYTDDPFHPSGVTDLIGWDPRAARLHHLSLHQVLVFGERPVKRFVIPWATIDRLPTVEHLPGLHVLPAAAELALLLARVLLRTSRPTRLRSPHHRTGVPLDARTVDELVWLGSRVDDTELAATAAALLPGSEDVLIRFRHDIGRERAAADIVALAFEERRRTLVRALRPLATRSATGARLAMLRHHRARVTRHVGAGSVVALVGADGAGKTTVSDAIRRRLGAKLTVEPLYLGLPRDAASIRLVSLVAAAARRIGAPRLGRWLESTRPVLAAWIRLRVIRHAYRAARRGVVCVTDRYPLEEFHAVEPPMDGPRLRGDRPLARLERSIYRAIPQQPDVLIALVADPELLLRRKPDDEDPAIVRAKAAAIRELETARADVIAFDVSSPLDTVITGVVTAIWNSLDRAGS